MLISSRMHRFPRSLFRVTRTGLALTLLMSFMVVGGCGSRMYVVEGGQQTYLLTNLHPDARGRILSLNYTGAPGAQLLRMCTPVTLDRVAARQIIFTDQTTRQRYRYTLHRSTRTPIDQHVARYFGTGCPNMATMSPEDQSGIQQGQVFQGMTKQGVILALGYPPEHRTPTLEEDVWRYWGNRSNAYEVYFTGGLVSGIRQ